MAVATQYVSWLSAAAAQAEAASSQASAIAAAFETALESTVQPAVVAANRNLVQALASTNHLGQNAPAIADIEAAYEQMWASDVVAMSGYHADASAAVAQLSPWQEVLPKLDVVYLLRVQKERQTEQLLPSLREYATFWGLDRRRVELMKPEAIIMHPGPMNRGVEIAADVADLERSIIIDQVTNGVAVRMSLLYLMLGAADRAVEEAPVG